MMFLKSIAAAAAVVSSAAAAAELPRFTHCAAPEKFTAFIKEHALETWGLGRLENGQIVQVLFNPATGQFVVFWHLKNGQICAAPGDGFHRRALVPNV